jgi:hypothetical protein
VRLGVDRIDSIDWFEDFSDVIVDQQNGDGSWDPSAWSDDILSTEWCVLTLLRAAAVEEEEVEEEEEFVEPEPEAAQLLVRNLRITPNETYPNQAVTIDAELFNAGGSQGSRDVQLVINGEFEQNSGVRGVGPGGTLSLRFTVYRANPGQYIVTVGETTGWFNVLTQPQITMAPQPGPQPTDRGELGTTGIISIAVIGVVVLAGIVVAWRLM